MIGLWQCKPIQWLVAVVTRSRSDTQPDKVIHSYLPNCAMSGRSPTMTSGPCNQCRPSLRLLARKGGMATDLVSPLTRVSNLDRLHRSAERDFSN